MYITKHGEKKQEGKKFTIKFKEVYVLSKFYVFI